MCRFIPDGLLDELHQPSTIGRTRGGGIDINRPRARAVMRAVVVLAAKPDGFTAADLVATVHATTGAPGYTVRQAAYDLRKLRGHRLLDKPGRGRRYQVPNNATRALCDLLSLREQIIAPLIAGVRKPSPGRPPATLTPIDRDYQRLRAAMNNLFGHLALTIQTPLAA